MARTLRPCGTEAAYRRHTRRGERPCNACREGRALERRDGRPPLHDPRLHPCGTPAARKRHQRAREACTTCGYVYTGVQGAPRTEPCGTEAGYQRHRRHDEQACGSCKTAHATYARERRAAA